MNVYFISGLAADGRVFQFIQLPAGFNKICIEWIAPLKNESLPDYAMRLSAAINIQSPFILVGLSMGGMIATEIAKHYPPRATILISSVALSNQLPAYFKLVFNTGIYKIVPSNILKSISVAKRVFSTETNEAKRLLVEVIRASDPHFIRWAIGAILAWENTYLPQPLWHIHGVKDGILPIKNLQPTHRIEHGTHLMLISRTEELNAFFEEVLFKTNLPYDNDKG